ncbi:carbohydrate ABC transporter permease [Paenibacillus sedimenti]|uniref:Carbohydrate ABC transporter permease n=1 Tax=Paenibacillus sedimenti TaxID=2770274 RepID=A0A926KMN5_9BACL|nr:carbohydrate ABC transporter permease [Paenibacillus sedimenti]MBD0379801.1 carbohydrate ABC transporter permease [Paenibacillus sedimenti]
MKRTLSETLGTGTLYVLLLFFSLLTLYPFWHVLMYAFSDPKQSIGGGLFLWPKGFSLLSFQMLLESDGIFQAYRNSLFRLIIGTSINVVLTATLAYPLANKRFVGRMQLTLFIFFTMLFQGGMIPSYLLVKSLGLINTPWALILPGAISAWNFFIMKNYFQSISPEIEESANLDGSTPLRTLFSIIIPISKPVIAAVALFYAVGHWNAYFDAVLYINSPSKQVLQVFLKGMLATSSLQQLGGTESFQSGIASVTEESIKMATVVISVLPMLIIYPFIQKYYVKGIMIGSVKG